MRGIYLQVREYAVSGDYVDEAFDDFYPDRSVIFTVSHY